MAAVKWFGSQESFNILVIVRDAQMGWTALTDAARNGHNSTVALLLGNGATVEQANKVRWHGLSSFSAGPDSVEVLVFCTEP